MCACVHTDDHWLYLFCKSWPSVDFKAGVVDGMTVVHGLDTPGSAGRPAMLSHTYARKEAQQAKDAMVADMARRGMKLHPVDRSSHGWLSDPDVPRHDTPNPSRDLPRRVMTAATALRLPLRKPLVSAPLACLDDAFWLHTRRFDWQEATSRTIACERGSDTSERDALWSAIRGTASTCAARPLTRVRPAVFGGWWATMHGLVKPLMHAATAGRTLLTPALPMWTDEATCANRSLSCIFEPLSACDRPPASSNTLGSSRDLETLNAAGPWVQSLSMEQQHARGTVHRRGWFWWTSALLAFVMRPTSQLAADVARAMSSTGLAAALSGTQPVVGLHVRQGDSCGRDAERSGRSCSPLAHYMEAVRRQTAGLNATTIYLATDSDDVLRQTREFPEWTWLHLPEATSFGRHVNPANKKWDAVLKSNKERGLTRVNMQLATVLTIDVLLLAQCDIFVGKHTSNLFRTAYELHSAGCDCAAPFESLDAPWCFDWMMPVGEGLNDTKFAC